MRKIAGVFGAPKPHWVGDGFPVRTLFSHGSFGETVSPFLLLDYAGPARFPPASTPRGVGVHPHKGFETVTIVYSGEVEHRDSTGEGGVIGPGDAQWMTAASGILHQEHHSQGFTRDGGELEMIQLWVNLPAADKNAPPGYQTLLDRNIPFVDLPDEAGRVRVIAGDFLGTKGPARTFTPVNLWDVRLRRGGRASFSAPEGHTLAIVVLKGAVLINGETIAREAQLALFERKGGSIAIEANSDAALLILSGEPIDEPVFMQGPFVMNSREEIRQAIDDFQHGRFGRIPA
ncbi:Pirin domain protein [Methylocella silvestris BL2]|uniref:Pirin domain protein n=1 Tax=Methylocella silvestris (strain DSM 15510 / CIP 108128 / LMG 27833 / NCIMB 13906 / BL2) TaxID=395965 RepID=B8EM97_METSB|nr:pirin family protein [Methylocella silvestris]ACK51486.1 Pirin domain protein [Methylocella silvestris BL2]